MSTTGNIGCGRTYYLYGPQSGPPSSEWTCVIDGGHGSDDCRGPNGERLEPTTPFVGADLPTDAEVRLRADLAAARAELAAAQAREARTREVMELASRAACRFCADVGDGPAKMRPARLSKRGGWFHDWTSQEGGSWCEAPLLRAALALPADRTALDAILASERARLFDVVRHAANEIQRNGARMLVDRVEPAFRGAAMPRLTDADIKTSRCGRCGMESGDLAEIVAHVAREHPGVFDAVAVE